MNNDFFAKSLAGDIQHFLMEDDFNRNHYYLTQLPSEQVECTLYAKSDLVLAGLPYFWEVFKYLGFSGKTPLDREGESFKLSENEKKQEIYTFKLPFNLAIQGERLALNLLQRASNIASFTHKFVEKVKKYNIEILDTRKTTPGLRSLEKYAVRIGGGLNHRFGQADIWMIKDNHKNFFGGLEQALKFFKNIGSHYQNIIVEIHDIAELKLAQSLGLKYVMLDNFSGDMLREAIFLKNDEINYEVSGGVNLSNIDQYLIAGIDAISVGALTYAAPAVDLSLKMKRVK